MSYKSTLQEHNTLLQQAIDKANDLPDAGGSGSVEMCTVTIANAFTPKENTVGTEFFLWVLLRDLKDGESNIESLFDYYSAEDGFVATVPKKSFCFVGGVETYESEGRLPGMLEEFEQTLYSVSVSGDIPWYSPHGTTPSGYGAYMIWIDGDCTITIGEDD